MFEGLPLVVLEAMGAGLPVIAARVVGSDEAVEDARTGRLVGPGDSAELVRALVEVLERPALGARWGVAGRRRFERAFTAERMARETMRVYDRLARRCECLHDR